MCVGITFAQSGRGKKELICAGFALTLAFPVTHCTDTAAATAIQC